MNNNHISIMERKMIPLQHRQTVMQLSLAMLSQNQKMTMLKMF
ncbi:hypothetical protein MtrunA17_Chr6g0486511 [Medicago truncatula]|uniref:Uncharacterized protein n=1 Tax=Medicago truncatula TaxID=3880 RepID=A0A396HNQ5_MEDTR|nr:hypothetical protein MtrunA17_Chr6g0486511 [Medicago truncatula]